MLPIPTQHNFVAAAEEQRQVIPSGALRLCVQPRGDEDATGRDEEAKHEGLFCPATDERNPYIYLHASRITAKDSFKHLSKGRPSLLMSMRAGRD